MGHILGIDIGGTAVKIGIVTNQGELLKKWEMPTDTTNKGETIVTDIWKNIQKQFEQLDPELTDIDVIGIGSPGFIDSENGIIYSSVNIGWKDFHLAETFQSLANLPVFVANDANVAALGEYWIGAGQGANNLIAVTLGTGVGGGIIVNGEIVNGENGTAGEIGHITVNHYGARCNCGRIGCLETIASATGIVRQAHEESKQNTNSLIAKFIEENGTITSKDVFDLANQGCQLSQDIIARTTDVLGLAISNVASLINPSKVLIGGGVSQAGEPFIEQINQSFKKYALPRIYEVCEIKLAALGNDAGIIGAAYYAMQRKSRLS